MGWFSDAFGSVGDVFKSGFDTVKGGISGVFNTGADLAKGVIGGGFGLANKVVDTAGGVANRVGNIADKTIGKFSDFLTSPFTLLIVAGVAILVLPKVLENMK
jgi:phage-related protein